MGDTGKIEPLGSARISQALPQRTAEEVRNGTQPPVVFLPNLETSVRFKNELLSLDTYVLTMHGNELFRQTAELSLSMSKGNYIQLPSLLKLFATTPNTFESRTINPLLGSELFMSHLLGERSLSIYAGLVDRAETSFAHSFIPELGQQGAVALAMCDNPDAVARAQGILQAMEKISRETRQTADVFANLEFFTKHFIGTVELAKKWFSVDAALIKKWEDTLLVGRGIVHDSNNILTVGMSYPELISMRARAGSPVEKLRDLLKVFSKFQFRNINEAVDLAFSIQVDKAKKKGVETTHGELIDFPLVNGAKADFFRIAYELTNNAIKYSDPDKERRVVHVESRVIGGKKQITFTDNGVGIPDINRALMMGERLHPKLAAGTGTGLPNVVALANKNGWAVAIQSEVGIGTAVTIEIPSDPYGYYYGKDSSHGFDMAALSPSGFDAMPTSDSLAFMGAQQVFIPPTVAFMPII